MKYLQTCLLLLFSVLFLTSKGQQNHFIYIQTENKQPFYVKLNDKLYSSSASGYLVISKMRNGAYDLSIGFPKKEWPEQKFNLAIDNKDLGFLLKNFEERGWGLFNLQSLNVVMSTDGINNKINTPVVVETKTDQFSNLLSDVVNDPSIKQVEQEKIPVIPEVAVAARTESVAIADTTVSLVSDTMALAIDEEKSRITRKLLNKNAEGTEMVFVDSYGGFLDTITVFIPVEKKELAAATDTVNKEIAESVPANKSSETPKQVNVPTIEYNTPVETKVNVPTIEYSPPVATNKTPSETSEPKTKDTGTSYRFIEMEPGEKVKKKEKAGKESKSVKNKEQENNPAIPTIEYEQDGKSASNLVMINSDCKAIATEDDFMKARKRMVREDNEEEMVNAAKKIFKTKCFNVEQVKNLSVLFLKDAGRYAFFDMAYPFVSDSHNFEKLQSLLTDTYYIDRFKVMLRK